MISYYCIFTLILLFLTQLISLVPSSARHHRWPQVLSRGPQFPRVSAHHRPWQGPFLQPLQAELHLPHPLSPRTHQQVQTRLVHKRTLKQISYSGNICLWEEAYVCIDHRHWFHWTAVWLQLHVSLLHVNIRDKNFRPEKRSIFKCSVKRRHFTAPYHCCLHTLILFSFAGPRTQINEITSYIDANWVYGNDEKIARRLRLFKGGLLKVSNPAWLRKRFCHATKSVSNTATNFTMSNVVAWYVIGNIISCLMFVIFIWRLIYWKVILFLILNSIGSGLQNSNRKTNRCFQI